MSASEVMNRAAQAHAFLDTARLTVDFSAELGAEAPANVAASLAVLSGIAAADAIAGKALGIRSNSANHLKALVGLKSTAAYEPRMITATKSAEAVQRAERLVALMDEIIR